MKIKSIKRIISWVGLLLLSLQVIDYLPLSASFIDLAFDEVRYYLAILGTCYRVDTERVCMTSLVCNNKDMKKDFNLSRGEYQSIPYFIENNNNIDNNRSINCPKRENRNDCGVISNHVVSRTLQIQSPRSLYADGAL